MLFQPLVNVFFCMQDSGHNHRMEELVHIGKRNYGCGRASKCLEAQMFEGAIDLVSSERHQIDRLVIRCIINSHILSRRPLLCTICVRTASTDIVYSYHVPSAPHIFRGEPTSSPHPIDVSADPPTLRWHADPIEAAMTRLTTHRVMDG